MLSIRPITLRAANAFVAEHHRHNQPTNGHKWSVACYDGERLCGVAIAGQPVARKLDDGLTVEIRRVCTDGTRNACSILYGACARIARDMGYKRVITYTLISENGASLKASGFLNCGEAGGVSWNMPSRPREVTQVTLFGEERKYPDEKRSGGKNVTNKGGSNHGEALPGMQVLRRTLGRGRNLRLPKAETGAAGGGRSAAAYAAGCHLPGG